MLPNIREHSIVVARVAQLLVQGFQKNGSSLNRDLALAGALLHDIAKTQCLGDNDGNHAKMGREICLKHGYERVGDIVASHVVLKSNGSGPVTEKEIVYYADKRVNHNQIVTLEERLAYINKTYGADNQKRQELIQVNFMKCLKLETLIFADLPFAPEDVEPMVEKKRDWLI
ncbi:MAG: HDIG domain-containing protein [Desulfobulbaceae bacterium]|uniref:HDIG domain-containing protein n=1 Tax=Candidatus Desulfobia pelagia TaxID=2841692 RepID=A0A8J6TFS6_9BACT|nr:HDIG domain-containing protein [Candidatus Desulfobia pelagia]